MQTDPARILVVDDTETNRDMLSRRLERRGHEVAIAENGLQALEALERAAAEGTPFDLVLLDVMMPGMDGPTLLAHLRKTANGACAPAIFMTARVQRAEIEQYLALGAMSVIAKPFDPLTLAGQIRQTLAEAQ